MRELLARAVEEAAQGFGAIARGDSAAAEHHFARAELFALAAKQAS